MLFTQKVAAKSWIQNQVAIPLYQGLVKGAKLCFRYPYFCFRHGESTSTASQLTSPASQKSKDLNKVLLLLQDLGLDSKPCIGIGKGNNIFNPIYGCAV